MLNKKCFKCQKRKPIELFYKHSQMADGHLNKCKTCTKKDVHRRYYDPESRLKIIKYEQARAQTIERKANALKYQRRRRKKNPGKNRARQIISNALRAGTITKSSCAVCSSLNVEAHHTDYRSPLKVTWLCRKHHLEAENKITYLQ